MLHVNGWIGYLRAFLIVIVIVSGVVANEPASADKADSGYAL